MNIAVKIMHTWVSYSLVLTLLVSVSFANVNDDIAAIQSSGDQSVSQVAPVAMDAMRMASLQNQADNKTLIDMIFRTARHSLPKHQQPISSSSAMLFVSFSMPESLLFMLADEAHAFNIPVVIKGLVDNDFKKTITTFARFNTEAKKQHFNFNGVSIDPIWFQQFNIASVPALVVSQRPASCERATVCQNQTFDVVYGNSNLKEGLKRIAEKGDAAPDLAKKILADGHV